MRHQYTFVQLGYLKNIIGIVYCFRILEKGSCAFLKANFDKGIVITIFLIYYFFLKNRI